MWLTLAFRPCSDILHMRYDLLCLFYNFLQILPQELFGLLCPRTVPFANHSKFLWGQGIKTEVLFGFQNFQIVTHRLLGCQFLKKNIGFFTLASFFFFFFFDASKNNSGYFEIYMDKLFLTSYVGLKIRKKSEIFAIFVFLPCSANPPRKAVKHLCDSWI